MARIRTIKPELAAHEGLFDLECETGLPIRFAWCMLFTVADREGRFAWRPRTLKAQILPHDDVDFSRVLDAWGTRGFIVKYRVNGEWFGWIPTFTKHQVINNRESPSDLPSYNQAEEVFSFSDQSSDNASATRQPRVIDASRTREVHAQAEGRKEGKGKEGRKEYIPTRAREENPYQPDDGGSWEMVQASYPEFTGRQDWITAEKYAYLRIEIDGLTWPELIAAVRRYAAYVHAGGVSGPKFVMTPAKFFSAPDKPWLQDWTPPPTKAEQAMRSNLQAAADFIAEDDSHAAI